MALMGNLFRHVLSYDSLTWTRPLDVGFPDGWEPEFGAYLRDVYQSHLKNPDHNSGHLPGVGVCQVAAFKGLRTTASAAFLSDNSSNLTVMTESPVERVLFEGRSAVGVKVANKICKFMLNSSRDPCLPENSR